MKQEISFIRGRMDEIIAHIKISDTRFLEQIPQFVPVYNYHRDESVMPQEWGCIRFRGLNIRLFADVESETKECYKIKNY